MKRNGVAKHKSIPSALWTAEITGRGIKSIRKLPTGQFSQLDHQYNGMPSMIVELEDNFKKQDALKCKSCLFKIFRRTYEATSQQYVENREWFIHCHGIELIVKILKNPPQLKPSQQQPRPTSYRNSLFSANNPSDNDICIMQRIHCMDILRELCFADVGVGEWLAADEYLLQFLFSLLKDKRTFDAAIGLVEEILASRKETFNLASITGFGDLVRSLSKGQLGLFCRILSMVIFEPEDKGGDEVVSSLELLNVRKQDPSRQSVRNIDRNHAVILGVPELLIRLVKLLRITCAADCRITDHIMAHTLRTAPDFNFTFPRRMDVDDDNWDIEDDLSTPAENPLAGALDPATIEQLEELLEASDSAKHLARLTYQVELLFVIYALLAGKRRADLQDQLAKIGLIPTLSTLFDTIDWLKPPPPVPPNERMHGPNCECNPESTLKIQFLRLVLNFCDGDFENRSNKKLLLSDDEYANLLLDTPVPSSKPAGLLIKLIQVFLKLPSEQPYRFWMSSCIEAFLRGSDPSFQRFVAIQCGLLKYLVNDILSENNKGTGGSLQTGFDLLGELMKFNREIFGEFNKLLVEDSKFTRFITNVTNNLVDSNVFLRAMILSMERFREEDSKNLAASPYPVTQCKIAKFLAESRLQLVMDLMTVISVEDINQENICCVNTALVLFIFARKHNELPYYLHHVAMTETNSRGQPGSITKNFRKLLWFWNEYYAQRGRDCLSLEFSSQVKFSEWLATYNSLVEELGEVEMPVLPVSNSPKSVKKS